MMTLYMLIKHLIVPLTWTGKKEIQTLLIQNILKNSIKKIHVVKMPMLDGEQKNRIW